MIAENNLVMLEPFTFANNCFSIAWFYVDFSMLCVLSEWPRGFWFYSNCYDMVCSVILFWHCSCYLTRIIEFSMGNKTRNEIQVQSSNGSGNRMRFSRGELGLSLTRFWYEHMSQRQSPHLYCECTSFKICWLQTNASHHNKKNKFEIWRSL